MREFLQYSLTSALYIFPILINCCYCRHGTHVAGTAAGVQVGVAKGARIVAVRILDCDGSGK